MPMKSAIQNGTWTAWWMGELISCTDASIRSQADEVISVSTVRKLDDARECERADRHHGVGDGVWVSRVISHELPQPVHFSGTLMPNNPVGRNTSVAIRIPKMRTSVHDESKHESEKARTNPMMRPPSAAPGMLPIPPNTAAVKAISPVMKPRNGSPLLM